MPIYEFQCWGCNEKTEDLRKLEDYTPAKCPTCGGSAEHIISAPALNIWNHERKFPNVTGHGDGSMTFESKDSYDAHLTENNLVESSQGGTVEGKKTLIASYK